MSSPPPFPFSSSTDPETYPAAFTQLPLSQILPPPFPTTNNNDAIAAAEPAAVIPASPSEQPSSSAPAPLPEPNSSDDEDSSAPPITLSASVVLTNIPRDSRVALANAFMPSTAKVTIRLLSVGSTPSLKKNVFTLTASKKFSVVVTFLRKKLKLSTTSDADGENTGGGGGSGSGILPNNNNNNNNNTNGQSLFVYVNSTFAPSLDEEVGNLFKCFKREDELVVNYCLTPAFG